MSKANRILCSNGYTFFTNETTIPGQARVNGTLMSREQAVTMFKNMVQQGITYTKEILTFNDNPCQDTTPDVGNTLSWRDMDSASH